MHFIGILGICFDFIFYEKRFFLRLPGAVGKSIFLLINRAVA